MSRLYSCIVHSRISITSACWFHHHQGSIYSFHTVVQYVIIVLVLVLALVLESFR